jgi:hypothetical protein
LSFSKKKKKKKKKPKKPTTTTTCCHLENLNSQNVITFDIRPNSSSASPQLITDHFGPPGILLGL